MWLNTETEVTQDLRPQSVAQTDVLEPDHVPLRRAAANVYRPVSPQSRSYIATPTALESTTFGQGGGSCAQRLLPEPLGCCPWFSLVSGPLTNGLLACGRIPVWRDSPMLITCTNCGTSYQVAAASLGPTGRSVRCARCKQTWFAANTEALADVAEDHRADLTALAEAPPVADSPAPEQHFAPSP